MTMDNPEHYVIIGNGATGNNAAAALRQGDKNGRITLISNECFPFYYRHKLCDFMVGNLKEEDLVVKSAASYKEKKIRLRLGQEVAKIDFHSKTVFLKHMEKIHFSKLLLATGGKPRVPETYYSCQHHFTFLKTLADAKRLKRLLPKIQRVLIIGGDLISIKVAKALQKLGKEILFMTDQNSFWPLTLNTTQQAEFRDTLATMGIQVITDDTLKSVVKEDEHTFAITTKQGKLLQTELIGSFFGQVPDVDVLLGSGLNLERGIIVNEFLETNIADVYAAGDCAQVYNPGIKNYWVSIGWHNAKRLGTLAGENMLANHGSTDLPKKDLFSFEGIKVSTNWWKEL
jgi:3-phenylpropionate/trans-cinnamate dioxygenase ferredoxin reductase component